MAHKNTPIRFRRFRFMLQMGASRARFPILITAYRSLSRGDFAYVRLPPRYLIADSFPFLRSLLFRRRCRPADRVVSEGTSHISAADTSYIIRVRVAGVAFPGFSIRNTESPVAFSWCRFWPRRLALSAFVFRGSAGNARFESTPPPLLLFIRY